MSPHASEASAHGSKRVRPSGPNGFQPFKSNTSTRMATTAVPPTAQVSPSDDESSLSESSEEPSDDSSSDDYAEADDTDEELQEDQEDNAVVNLPANRGKKPAMKLDHVNLGQDVRPFLKQFLPKLKAANDELEAQKRAGTLKTLDAGAGENGEQYIQMEVGLGVLEEKHFDTSSHERHDRDGGRETNSETEGILAKLMGHEETGSTTGIEVLQDDRSSRVS